MPFCRQANFVAGLLLLGVVCANGCASPTGPNAPVSVAIDRGPQPIQRPSIPAAPSQSVVLPAAFEQPQAPACPLVKDDPLSGPQELDPDRLVAEVLRRNPSLEAMVSAWQAAAARYPQAVSLEDPMLSLAIGPGTFGDPNHDVAWMVEGSQKIPWSGKRQLRGQQASAEASAAHADVDDAELRLVEATRLALLDYYLVRRDLALNAEALELSHGFRDIADSHYRHNLVTQQDILQADLELAELQRRNFELQRMNRVAMARINILLHRPADLPLAPPPSRLPEPVAAPSLEMAQQLAAERRPDLMALGERARAEQTAVAIAEREYYPDVTVVGRYDGFWQGADRNLAPLVGMNMNVPLNNDRRRAAVCEAQFRASQRRAEYEARLDEIHADVTAAWQQLDESGRVIDLYAKTIMPVAEQNLQSARANYTANKIDFLRLIEAQRQIVTIREKREEALADYQRRLADLELATGGPIAKASAPAEPIPPPQL